jgi:hypothetical protein
MRKRYQQAAMRLERARGHLRHSPTDGGGVVGMRDALLECEMALGDLHRHGLTPEGPAGSQAARLAQYVDRSGIEDPAGRGVYLVRAAQFTREQRREAWEAVDAVAGWAAEGYAGRQS